MIIIRLIFIVCTFFVILVLGLFALLFLKLLMNAKNGFPEKEDNWRPYKHGTDDKVIQGEYKIIDETHKDREAD